MDLTAQKSAPQHQSCFRVNSTSQMCAMANSKNTAPESNPSPDSEASVGGGRPLAVSTLICPRRKGPRSPAHNAERATGTPRILAKWVDVVHQGLSWRSPTSAYFKKHNLRRQRSSHPHFTDGGNRGTPRSPGGYAI